MTGAAQITALTRSAAHALIERETRTTGSRMAAYQVVAAMIGMSPSWLRKFIGRDPETKLSIPAALNIKQRYDRLCSRIEADAAANRARAMALKVQIDEAHQGAFGMVERVADAPPGTEEA